MTKKPSPPFLSMPSPRGAVRAVAPPPTTFPGGAAKAVAQPARAAGFPPPPPTRFGAAQPGPVAQPACRCCPSPPPTRFPGIPSGPVAQPALRRSALVLERPLFSIRHPPVVGVIQQMEERTTVEGAGGGNTSQGVSGGWWDAKEALKICPGKAAKIMRKVLNKVGQMVDGKYGPYFRNGYMCAEPQAVIDLIVNNNNIKLSDIVLGEARSGYQLKPPCEVCAKWLDYNGWSLTIKKEITALQVSPQSKITIDPSSSSYDKMFPPLGGKK